ncbi:hypothetical protein K2173_021600 [Erythroxylum novogranatense]|uniref:Uncharacterized protein n=1 Tax=Erythroxylum novogranatense TaxID=1862640 RepID=A0AAV8TNC8_9ROSI|nr:hypothetical protein K2173_021600 [Erythroxylum novogranatense]
MNGVEESGIAVPLGDPHSLRVLDTKQVFLGNDPLEFLGEVALQSNEVGGEKALQGRLEPSETSQKNALVLSNIAKDVKLPSLETRSKGGEGLGEGERAIPVLSQPGRPHVVSFPCCQIAKQGRRQKTGGQRGRSDQERGVVGGEFREVGDTCAGKMVGARGVGKSAVETLVATTVGPGVATTQVAKVSHVVAFNPVAETFATGGRFASSFFVTSNDGVEVTDDHPRRGEPINEMMKMGPKISADSGVGATVNGNK